VKPAIDDKPQFIIRNDRATPKHANVPHARTRRRQRFAERNNRSVCHSR
jgi:hypothetical protein